MEIENDDVTDSIGDELNIIRKKFMPYQREIMLPLFIILVMLVVFLGYAYGAAKVCDQVGGILDGKLRCHLDYKQNTTYMYMERQSVVDPTKFNLTK